MPHVNDYTTIVRLEKDGDNLYYIAEHPEIEGGFSDGETVQEALENLQEVTSMILEHLDQHNLPIPEPRPLISTKIIRVASRSLRETLEELEPNLEIMPLIPHRALA